MPIEIKMPRLTDSMTESAVVAWRKIEGEPVRAGEVIAEIQADKTTVDFEAPDDGTLSKIVTPAGTDGIKVGDTIACLQRPGEATSSPADRTETAAEVVTRNENGRPDQDVESIAVAASEVQHGKPLARADVTASPLARSMAAQAGIDLSRLNRNGPQDRITIAEVLAELGAEPRLMNPVSRATAAVSDRAPGPSESDAPFDEVSHSRMRQIIAQRLSGSTRVDHAGDRRRRPQRVGRDRV
jgi:pyruvate dehydrogenase E2 component (dihydrolipoamide acetyltransferase)